MLKKAIIISICSLFLNLSSCATYIEVRALKPAMFNLGDADSINIEPFELKSNFNSDETTSFGAVAADLLVNFIFEKAGQKSPIKKYPYDQYNEDKLTKQVHEKLLGNGFYDIHYNKKLSPEGVTIKGSGEFWVDDRGNWYEEETRQNNTIIKNKKFHLTRSVRSSVTYIITDNKTNKVIASKTNEDSNSVELKGFDEDEVRRNIQSWKNILENQISHLSYRIRKEIIPFYVTESREIKSGKSKEMERALEYAKKSLWQDASKIWQEVYDNKLSYGKEDYINSTYNLGVYNEINQNFDKAFDYYELCYKDTNDLYFLKAKNRVNNINNPV